MTILHLIVGNSVKISYYSIRNDQLRYHLPIEQLIVIDHLITCIPYQNCMLRVMVISSNLNCHIYSNLLGITSRAMDKIERSRVLDHILFS